MYNINLVNRGGFDNISMLYVYINVRILKLIAIGIVEKKADKELSSIRVSLGEKLGIYLARDDFDRASIIFEVLKKNENEINDWKNKWVSRIEKL